MSELRKQFHDYQWKVLESEKQFIAAIAGVQSGKTTVGAAWMHDQISRHQKDDHLIAAPTYKILQQSTLPKFFDEFPFYRQWYKSGDSIIDLPEGGRVFIRSTEDPYKLEGMTLRSAWLDEGGQMKPATWVVIQARTAIKRGKVLITTTPYNMGWLYLDIYKPWQQGDEHIEVLNWSSEHNPFFPKEEFERIKAKYKNDPTVFEMRYLGHFRKRHGLVYPNFSDSMLEDDVKQPFTRVIAGIDWGYTNPAAMIVIGIDWDKHYWILDEYYEREKTTAEIIQKAKGLSAKYKINTFYADSAEPDRIAEAKKEGLYVIEAQKEIKLGIDQVRQVINEKRLHVSKACRNTVDEIENYHYPEEGEAGYEKDLPKKENDHLMDALRYAIYTDDPVDPVRETEMKVRAQMNRHRKYQFT